jgi:hypothetical protein
MSHEEPISMWRALVSGFAGSGPGLTESGGGWAGYRGPVRSRGMR